jgi:hypothetical protein
VAMALHVTIIVCSCVMCHMTMTAKWSCHDMDRIMDDEGILMKFQMEMSSRLLGTRGRTSLCNLLHDMAELCSCPTVLWQKSRQWDRTYDRTNL